MYALFAVFHIAAAISEHVDGRGGSELRMWFVAGYVLLTYVFWTHWTGRAFRKKAARARVVSRPKR